MSEQDAGDVIVECNKCVMNHNDVIDQSANPGVEILERDEGSVYLDLFRTLANGNSGDGISVLERDSGSVMATFLEVVTNENGLINNGLSPQHGVNIVGEGEIIVDINRLTALRNRESGLFVHGGANVEVSIDESHLNDNGEFGIEANSDTSMGELIILRTNINRNGSGDVNSNL